MKKAIWILLLICSFAFADNIGIIPTPQEIEISESVFRVCKRFNLELLGDPQNLSKGYDILWEALSQTADKYSEGSMSIILEKADGFNIDNLSKEQLSEAYILEILAEKIHIRSGSDRGLFYGLMSLSS